MKMMIADMTWLDTIEIVGGHPVVDFINTLHSYTEAAPRDYLQSAGHVIAWCQYVGLIDGRQAQRLTTLDDVAEGRLLNRARDLRATLYTVLRGHLQRRPNREAVARLNRGLGRLARWRILEPGVDGFAWQYQITAAHPHSLFAPLVFSAAELLQSSDLSRLKVCPPPDGCGWLFIDRSRNGSRSWCSMKTCGNLAKQRRHRARRSLTE